MTFLYCYFLINKGLKLSSGKIASQVGHASQLLTQKYINTDIWNMYNESFYPKIILKVPNDKIMQEILNETINYEKVMVIDKGMTQCPPNTMTVVGFGPIMKNDVPDCFKNLKLL